MWRVHQTIVTVEKQCVLHLSASAQMRGGAQARVCACVHVALLIQHATRMRHVVTSFAAPLAPPLSHKRRNFLEKTLLGINVYSDFLYKFYLKQFSF
jgi:hypothetical protein